MGSSGEHTGEGFLPMTVHNTGFLLDKLGQDCHPLQFLRELTQNSIEAIQRTGGRGTIIWDADWHAHDLEEVYKLCVTDDGDGMTGEDMVRFINQLSSSISEQTLTGNYGVGAKVATAARNHCGVVYLSWKVGQGAMIQLCRDPKSHTYGLKQWHRADGSYGHYLPMEDDCKPAGIDGHGTRVVLLGNSDDEDTMKAPPASPLPSRWISKYLNTRYFLFPEGITVKAREGWQYPRSDANRNYLRTLTGQKPYLDKYTQESGCVSLSQARAHWWILRDEGTAGKNSGFIESSGHMAALYQNELYELAAGRSGMSRLQQFGITFGYRWVVIYVEPHIDRSGSLTTNTSRTVLQIDSEPLPWWEWAAEFQECMPRELRDFVEENSAKSITSDHAKSIRDRLKDIMPLFNVSRYRPIPEGPCELDTDRLVGGTAATAAGGGNGPDNPSVVPSKRRVSSNIYSVFEKRGGAPGKKVETDPIPEVKWVSVADGTRQGDLIEDRAAKYLPEKNLLLMNADFRAFADMESFLRKELGQKSVAGLIVRDALRAWLAQALIETVLGVQGLCNSKQWSRDDIDDALSEEALTGSAMQKYHVYLAVRKELGIKLGALKR